MPQISQSAPCPRCGTELMNGSLHDALDLVYYKALKGLETGSLRASICPACGYVELQATTPEIMDYESLAPRAFPYNLA